MTCNTLYSDGTGISGHSPTPRRESIESLAKHIRLLVLDVDGVMTDGGLYYDANGLVMKRFLSSTASASGWLKRRVLKSPSCRAWMCPVS